MISNKSYNNNYIQRFKKRKMVIINHTEDSKKPMLTQKSRWRGRGQVSKIDFAEKAPIFENGRQLRENPAKTSL